MRPSSPILALALAGLIPATVAAADLPPLAQNERVRGEFLAGAVGDAIVDNCPTISARMTEVVSRLWSLRSYARSLGYTDAQIREFRKSEANKAELDRLRDTYLAQNGVVAGDPQSYCALGRREIENRSLIGSLIRAR